MPLDEQFWFRPLPHGDPPWLWRIFGEKFEHPDWQKAAGAYLQMQQENLQSQIKFVQSLQGVVNQIGQKR